MGKFMHMMHWFLTSILILLIVIPLIPLVLWSLSGGWKWPEVLPHAFSLRAWQYVFSASAGTWQAVGVSLEIAGVVALINLVLALPAANALARLKFRGKWMVEAVLYAPLIIPPFVSVMGMYITFIQLGLTGTITGVVLAHVVPTLPYMLRALIVSYKTLGFQWEEQARMLGALRFQRLWYIVLPHLLPGIVAGSSLSILVSLSQYLITFLVGGGQVLTLSLVLFPFINGGDVSIGAAYTIVFAVLAALMLWLMEVLLKRYYGKQIQVHV